MDKRVSQSRVPARFAWSDLRRDPDTTGGDVAAPPDWTALSRHIEQRKRLGTALSLRSPGSLELLGRLTWITFRLEGLEIQESEVVQARLVALVSRQLALEA